jgi:hypothetical protein
VEVRVETRPDTPLHRDKEKNESIVVGTNRFIDVVSDWWWGDYILLRAIYLCYRMVLAFTYLGVLMVLCHEDTLCVLICCAPDFTIF